MTESTKQRIAMTPDARVVTWLSCLIFILAIGIYFARQYETSASEFLTGSSAGWYAFNVSSASRFIQNEGSLELVQYISPFRGDATRLDVQWFWPTSPTALDPCAPAQGKLVALSKNPASPILMFEGVELTSGTDTRELGALGEPSDLATILLSPFYTYMLLEGRSDENPALVLSRQNLALVRSCVKRLHQDFGPINFYRSNSGRVIVVEFNWEGKLFYYKSTGPSFIRDFLEPNIRPMTPILQNVTAAQFPFWFTLSEEPFTDCKYAILPIGPDTEPSD